MAAGGWIVMDAVAGSPAGGAGFARRAWPLGLLAAAACVVTPLLTVALGLADSVAPLLLGYSFGALMGILGAVIARRHPQNCIGWLMCGTSLATTLVNLPGDYAYAALVLTHGRLPLGVGALWLAGWAWVIVIGLSLPMITARFPDGGLPQRDRIVDWLAVGGSALWAAGNALGPVIPTILPPSVVPALAPYRLNPIGTALPPAVLAELSMAGLPLVLAGYGAAAWSLVGRFRRAPNEERAQLKWFALAGILVAIAVVYAGFATIALRRPLGEALIPFELVLVALPVAIAIAILRDGLYDIDVLINRALVYASLSAILGALYVATVTLLERVFITATGQHSDAAYVVTAFVVVAAFGPIRDGLQRKVDRHLGGANPLSALDQFRAQVDVVVAVLDGKELAVRLVDQAVMALDSHGGALYLDDGALPTYQRGDISGAGAVEVLLGSEQDRSERLVLGEPRGRGRYSSRDLDLLRRSAASVAVALSLARDRERRQPAMNAAALHGQPRERRVCL